MRIAAQDRFPERIARSFAEYSPDPGWLVRDFSAGTLDKEKRVCYNKTEGWEEKSRPVAGYREVRDGGTDPNVPEEDGLGAAHRVGAFRSGCAGCAR